MSRWVGVTRDVVARALGWPTAGASADPVLYPYTWAALPAVGNAGRLAYVSDYGAGGTVLRDNGTRWKPVGTADLKTLDTTSSSIPNSETVVFQYLIPANVLQNKDRLRLWATMTKSGTTDTGTLRLRMGTAGTTADTLLYGAVVVAAANRTVSFVADFRLDSATALQQLGVNAGTGAQLGYSAAATSAFGAAIAITSAAANALWFSVSLLSSSTNDTVALQDAHLQLIPTTA